MTSEPPIEELHHIGIAVHSIKESLPRWTDGFGLKLQSMDDVPDEQVRVAVLMAGSTRIELIEPMNPDSPVAKFLEKRGPGVHHLAFAVSDCQGKLDGMAARGAPTLNKVPNNGAHDCKVAFVHPKYLGGVLAELVEDPHRG
jgi:methylmalonyl-CoA/ethylmalonyl-CoA epimerase